MLLRLTLAGLGAGASHLSLYMVVQRNYTRVEAYEYL
jgi:hypothetical protein